MKVKLSLLLLVVSIVVTAPSGFAQAGVAGKWTGELSATDGHGVAQPITIDLKLDGTNLSGTLTEGALEARPIQAATVDGNNVAFRTSRNLGGSDINVNWKGELKGDDLALSREIGPAPAEAGGGRGGGAGGGRGGAAAGGGRGGAGGGRGGAAPAAAAAGAQAPAAAAPIPPVPTADAGAAPAAGGRGGGGRGGRGGAAPAAAGGQAGAAPAGRGAAPAGPTVQLTLHRAK